MMKTPVLLLTWRRPAQLLMAIEALRPHAPRRVFVACDGPRADCEDDKVNVAEVRRMIPQAINWNCELATLYFEDNQGCRLGVSRGISWFFENVEEGIILEEDCVAHKDFFLFCSVLLEKYRNDDRVWCISGSNFQRGQLWGEASYYFSKYPHCWGWATWRRCWQHFQVDIPFWPKWKQSRQWTSLMDSVRERAYWEQVLGRSHAGILDSWAYPWTACVWRAGGLTAAPQVNLVQNIGFGQDATHTQAGDDGLSIPSQALGFIRHPAEVALNRMADSFVFDTVFLPSPSVQKPGFIGRLRNSLAKRLRFPKMKR